MNKQQLIAEIEKALPAQLKDGTFAEEDYERSAGLYIAIGIIDKCENVESQLEVSNQTISDHLVSVWAHRWDLQWTMAELRTCIEDARSIENA